MSEQVIYVAKKPRFIVQRNIGDGWDDWYGFEESSEAIERADELILQNPDTDYRVVERT